MFMVVVLGYSMNPAVFRYLPFAGFFFVCTTSRAVLLSILPLKALLLVGNAHSKQPRTDYAMPIPKRLMPFGSTSARSIPPWIRLRAKQFTNQPAAASDRDNRRTNVARIEFAHRNCDLWRDVHRPLLAFYERIEKEG